MSKVKQHRQSNALNLLLAVVVMLQQHTQYSTAQLVNTSAVTTTSTQATTTKFVPHRFSSSNNITILHEVHEPEVGSATTVATTATTTTTTTTTSTESSLQLNKHEVLPLKPQKKKPYTLFDKPLTATYEKARPLKEYELHPIPFDYNLGDLEDLAHASIRKGDLSAEVKHMLANDDDEGLTYADGILDIDVPDAEAVGLDIALVTTETSSTTTTTTAAPTTPNTTASNASAPHIHLPIGVSAGPHILKIFSNKNTKREHDLLKKNERVSSTFNSISRYFGNDPDVVLNATADSLQATANLFQIVTNLFDHFYWQTADIRRKVTTSCGLEIQAYLTALHENYEWAQKAYDASGHYRGQLLFGSDKWLGQKNFCYELKNQLQPNERRHFEFAFYMAIVELHMKLPEPLHTTIQLGECLPKSCTALDVQAILQYDPHAHMLTTLDSLNAKNISTIYIKRVRMVPGLYSHWRDLGFQMFVSIILTFIALVLLATYHQAQLTQRECAVNSIPAISAKLDAMGMMSTTQNGTDTKAYEVYQMRTLGENNNVVDMGEADLNSRKPVNGSGNGANKVNGNADVNINGSVNAKSNMATNASGNKTVDGHVAHPVAVAAIHDSDRSQHMADMETGSSFGASAHYEAKQQLGFHEQILLCFAFQKNAAAILNMDDQANHTSCLHGLRVLSVLWVIMVHTYLQMFSIAENVFQRVIVERSILYQVVGNATFSVDTFFFISGLLVTLIYLKHEKIYPENLCRYLKSGGLEAALALLYRYIRLTPAYLFAIFLNNFVLRQSNDSSVIQVNAPPNSCSKYWWRNIFYVNNFYPLNEICMMWSWYMANDMQFYVMAIVLLILAKRYFKIVVLVLCTFLLSSWGIAGIISLQHHYTHKVSMPFESFDFLYDKPWQRVGTYIMGILTGYIIYKVKTPPRMPRKWKCLLWFGSSGLLALIIFGVWQGELSELQTAFYVSVGHTAFGFALIWLVLSCCWNYTPTINRILSYRGLWPLSRLTYCTYLIHPIVMRFVVFRMTGTIHLSNLFVLTIFLGNAIVSFGVGFFVSILFEAPIIRLLKVCFRK